MENSDIFKKKYYKYKMKYIALKQSNSDIDDWENASIDFAKSYKPVLPIENIIIRTKNEDFNISLTLIKDTLFENFIDVDENDNTSIDLRDFIDNDSFKIVFNYLKFKKWNYDTTIPYGKYKNKNNGMIEILDYSFPDPRPMWQNKYVNFNFFLLDHAPYTKNYSFWNELKKFFAKLIPSSSKIRFKDLANFILEDKPLPEDIYYLDDKLGTYFRKNLAEIQKKKKIMEKDFDVSEDVYQDRNYFFHKHFDKLISEFYEASAYFLSNIEWNKLTFSEKEYYYYLSKINPSKYGISKSQILDLKADVGAEIYCKKRIDNGGKGCIFDLN